ncbi:MAG: hypothetical protein WD750_01095 [Gammaproteobacteria bacterium]
MSITEEKSVQTHTLRTLWSETLFEMLYEAVEHNWSVNATREILKELVHKGYKLNRVVEKVEKRFGDPGKKRLLSIIQDK